MHHISTKQIETELGLDSMDKCIGRRQLRFYDAGLDLLSAACPLIAYPASRIQLAPHARHGAVPMTESELIPVLCVNDEVTKSERTGITIAYTEDMLSRERTIDCIMH